MMYRAAVDPERSIPTPSTSPSVIANVSKEKEIVKKVSLLRV